MGPFDNKEMNKRIKDLEKNIDRLLESQSLSNKSISQLKSELIELSKRSPEYEKEAQQASKKASEYRNRANDTFEEVKVILENSKFVERDLNTMNLEIETIKNELNFSFQNFKSENEEIDLLIASLKERIDDIQSNIELFEETIDQHPDFETEINELEGYIVRIKQYESQSNQLMISISNRKIQVETLYNEILGYKYENEESSEIIEVKGLRQELKESFDGLEDRFDSFKESYYNLESSTKENVTNLLEINSKKINTQISEWEAKYKHLNKEIEELLPKALTAGLSHAFSEKKREEDLSYAKHKKQFGYGIWGMIGVSLIPFIISITTLLNNEALDTVINRAPKLVVAILPLYIPVLWLSISSSKKLNLSKRLIEEYTHKEVLSKTYEGLSKQIQNIEENEISKELRIKLLQDFLQMYSENPGKLISDYNKSDHPIMELLESSNKFDKTIQKVKKIPGLNKFAEILEKKSEIKFEQSTNAIGRSLNKGLVIDESMYDSEQEEIA